MKSASLAILMASVTAAAPVLANDYFPTNQQLHYQFAGFGNTTAESRSLHMRQTATEDDWVQYDNFAGFSNLWLWRDEASQALYFWDKDNQRPVLLADFTEPPGSRYAISGLSCYNESRLDAWQTDFALPGGREVDVITLTLTGCDHAVLSLHFGYQLGLIGWTVSQAEQQQQFLLISARQDNQWLNLSTGLNISATLPAIVDTSTTPLLPVVARLTNTHSQPLQLQFSSSQQFDILLYNEQEQLVRRWSDDKRFMSANTQIHLAPGESTALGDALLLRDSQNQPLPAGRYRVVFRLPDALTTEDSRLLWQGYVHLR